MAANVLVDAGFLIALLAKRDTNHRWAVTVAKRHPPPWITCEAVVSEAFDLLGKHGAAVLAEIFHRDAVRCAFRFQDEIAQVLGLMRKYADVPMSLANACLVRMTETLPDPLLLTTDADFRIYRRSSRRIVPCALPQ